MSEDLIVIAALLIMPFVALGSAILAERLVNRLDRWTRARARRH